MFMEHFTYFAPQSAAEVVALLGRLGKRAKVLAGGTDLLVLMKDRILSPECLINIADIIELRGILYEPGKGATIGAATKIAEIEHSEIIRDRYYALHQAAGALGSAQVRAMATIGGNSCNASPAAETPTPLVALGAEAVISSLAGERQVPLEQFITGNRKTVLAEGELLTKFILPEPVPRSAGRYSHVGLRDAMEIDAVNMAVNLVLEDDNRTVKYLKLVMGSVAPRPLVSEQVPGLLVGREFSDNLVEEAALAASGEAKPISDIRASAEYRSDLVAVLARRLLHETFAVAREV